MNAFRVLIVASSFYPNISKELVKGAEIVFKKAKIDSQIVTVPGAFEIPAAIKFAIMADKNKVFKHRFSGFVALGCVVKGETDHYQHICNETTRALMDIAVNDSVPLGFGILTVGNIEQARVRADFLGDKNVGGRAAQSCMKMIELKKALNSYNKSLSNE